MSTIPALSRPSSVTWSFLLWLLTILLGVVGAVIILATVMSDAGVRGDVLVGVVVAVAVVSIVIALVELFFAVKMRQGRNWARIVLLILAVLQICGNVAQIGSNNLSSWLGLAVVVVAACLMFTPASNRYFHRSTSGLTAQAEGYDGF